METVIDAEYTIPSVALTNREDQRIIEWRQEIGKLLCYANAAEVKDLDTAREATNDLTAIASLDREIEEVRKACKQPALEAGRAIDQFFATLTEDLKTAKVVYAKKMATYHAEQERIRKEAEAINKAVEAEVVEVPDQQKHVRAETGTVTFMAQVDKEKVQAAIDGGVREIKGLHIYPVWTFKVLDVKQVPEEYRKVGTRVNGVRG